MRIQTQLLLTTLAVVAVVSLPALAADNDAFIKSAMWAAPEGLLAVARTVPPQQNWLDIGRKRILGDRNGLFLIRKC